MVTAVAQALWLEVIYPLLSAPSWWYSRGLARAIDRYVERLREGDAYLGASVWWRNLFIPMYGQTDLAGRIISLGVRFIQGLVRGAAYVTWVFLATLLVGGYVGLPLFIGYKLISIWVIN
jgi:hypothetical protein